MADPVIVEFGAKIDALVSGVSQVKRQIESVNDTVKSFGTGFIEAILGAFSVVAVEKFIEAMGRLGESLERTSTQLGTTMQQTIELRGMSLIVGTSLEAMTLGFERLYLNVQKSTHDAFSPASQALKVLGISAKELTAAGNDTGKMIDILHGAVSKFNPSMNLTAAVMAVGGRGIAQLIPLLHLQGDAWDTMRAAVRKASDGLKEAAPGMAETDDKIDLMRLSAESLGARIFTVLKPAIDTVIEALTLWMQKLDYKTIQEYARWLVDVLGNAIITIITLFKEFGITLDNITTKIERILTGAALGGALGLLGGPGMAALGAGIGGATVALWDRFFESWDKGSAEAKAKVDADTKELVAKIQGMMEKIKAAMSGVPIEGQKPTGQTAGTMNMGGRDAIEAEKSRIQTQIEILRGELEQRKIIYQIDADNYATSQVEKVRRTIDATRAIQAQEAELMTRIRDLYPLHSKEWEAAERARVQATMRATTEMLRLNAEYIRAARAEVGGYIDQVQSSWNSSLRDLLAGTTSFGAAMKKVLADLVVYSIQQIQKKFIFEQLTTMLTNALYGTEVTTKVAGETAKTAATAAGVTARTSAEASGAAASTALVIPGILKAIMNSAAQTFAGVFAFFSPVMGPAAAAPAGASSAVVAAAAGGISALDVGTDYVARTGLAIIHKGEQVVPAQAQTPFTGANMGGGGSVTANISVQAWDARSVQQWLHSGGDKIIAAAVSKIQNRNPSARPAY